MKEIKLSKGGIAIIDDIDFELVSSHKWFLTSYGYAARWSSRKTGKRKLVFMHVEIMGGGDKSELDHIGEKLDNRRKNIRRCAHSENSKNRRINKNSTTGYKGVSWNKSNRRFMAYINSDGKRIHIGYFDNPVSAAIAYNDAAVRLHGKFARLNAV